MKKNTLEKGFGMIGIILSVALLIFFMYLSVQGYENSDSAEGEKQSTYVQGKEAIDEAEEVKKALESRYQ